LEVMNSNILLSYLLSNIRNNAQYTTQIPKRIKSSFPVPLLPPFLCAIPLLSCERHPVNVRRIKTPAPRPRLCVTPWGTHRTKPTQGRATFKPSVLRRQCGGGLHCPSPSPPGFPLSKEK
jgi:hypothetical protein